MIGFYNYTVILTYIGTMFGFVGMTYAWSGNLKMSLICLMVAGLCDMFDGKIASTMERTKPEKRFGIQIDSLSDLICFGVLPAVIVLQCSGMKILHMIFAGAYVLCALIRLAWFNVDEEERQEREAKSREVYLGLPVTTAALALPYFIAIASMAKLPFQLICPWLLLAIAIGFISPFSLKKPGNVGKVIMLLIGVLGFVLLLIGVKA